MIFVYLVGVKLKNFGIFKDSKIGQTNEDEYREKFLKINIFIGGPATGKKTLREAFNCMIDSCFGAIHVYDKHLRDYYVENVPIEITFFFKDRDLYSYRIVFGEDKKHRTVFLEESLINVSENRILLELKNKYEDWLSDGFVLSKNGKQVEIEVKTSDNSGLGSLYDKELSDEVLVIKNFFDNMRMLNLSTEKMKTKHPLVNVFYVGTKGERLEDFLSLALENDRENTDKMIQSAGECFDIKRLKMYKKDKYIFFSADNMSEKNFYQMSDGFLCYLARMSIFKGLRTFPNDYDGKMSLLFDNMPENHLDVKRIEDLSSEIWRGLRDNKMQQFFAVTYNPFFLNSFTPICIWNMERDLSGNITARKISQYPYVNEMYQEGITLGNLWYDEYFSSP